MMMLMVVVLVEVAMMLVIMKKEITATINELPTVDRNLDKDVI